MITLDSLKKKLPEIEARLGYTFQNKDLLWLSFIHRSYVNENKQVTQHNERLEFLGDSVLGLLIADYLYATMPNTPEGELSYLRSRLVEASACVVYAEALYLKRYLIMGKGERMNDGRGRDSILSDLFEALVGAIYLDGGLEAARSFLFTNLQVTFEEILKTPIQNWKALLQDYSQKKFQQPPVYRLVSESGPDHNKVFEVAVALNQEEVGFGQGESKKEAQQSAAKDALNKLSI